MSNRERYERIRTIVTIETTQFTPDPDEIFNAIVSCDVPADAKEQAAALAEAWVEQCAGIDAANSETIGVEVPFWLQLAPNTFVVGTMDRIARDEQGVFGCEWKSTAKKSPARGSFKGWGPEQWYDDIKRGHQLGTYAGALANGGNFIGLNQTSFPFATVPVRILVRAVSKSSPPEIWPTPMGAFVEIDQKRIDATLNTYRVVAEQIRAARRAGLVPWQLRGSHCLKYNRFLCPHAGLCEANVYPSNAPVTIGSFSPGSQKAVEKILLTRDDRDDINDVVILSSSTLSDWQQCAEKWRRNALGGGDESSEALDVGSVLHSALGNLYEQHQKFGRKNKWIGNKSCLRDWTR